MPIIIPINFKIKKFFKYNYEQENLDFGIDVSRTFRNNLNKMCYCASEQEKIDINRAMKKFYGVLEVDDNAIYTFEDNPDEMCYYMTLNQLSEIHVDKHVKSFIDKNFDKFVDILFESDDGLYRIDPKKIDYRRELFIEYDWYKHMIILNFYEKHNTGFFDEKHNLAHMCIKDDKLTLVEKLEELDEIYPAEKKIKSSAAYHDTIITCVN